MNKLLRNLAIVAGAAVASTALAQDYTHNPFYENTAAHSHNYALRAVEIRLNVLENVVVDDDEVYEEAGEGLEDSLAAIKGSLSAVDAELYEQYEEVLEQIAEAAEEGEDYADLLVEAKLLTEQVHDVLLGADFNSDPVNLGALLARILLAEGGVAEGWEEIFEGELAEFAIGWSALQRTNELWADLAPYASEQQAFEVQDSLDFLATELYAEQTPPEGFELMDAEAGEAPAHRIVSYLETITDATLYPERNLGALVGLIDDLAVEACGLFDAGDALMGEEVLGQSFYFYDENLVRMLDLFDPELQETLEGDYATALESDTCGPLLDNLTTARGLLGG